MTDEGAGQVGTYAYDAWGNVTASSGAEGNEYKFTSRRWDSAVGLQYNRARFYDPAIGRFISPDPLTGGPDDPTISYFGGLYSAFHRYLKEYVDGLQPDKLNRYAYCYNNPVNLIDPLGLSAEEAQTGELEVEAEDEKEGEKRSEIRGPAQDTTTRQKGQNAAEVKRRENSKEDQQCIDNAIEFIEEAIKNREYNFSDRRRLKRILDKIKEKNVLGKIYFVDPPEYRKILSEKLEWRGFYSHDSGDIQLNRMTRQFENMTASGLIHEGSHALDWEVDKVPDHYTRELNAFSAQIELYKNTSHRYTEWPSHAILVEIMDNGKLPEYVRDYVKKHYNEE